MNTGYIYLICDPANDMYKIGVTRTLQSNRIKKLQTGNPTELHIVSLYQTAYPFRMEKMLHFKFCLKNELNEWFNLNNYDIVHFLDTCKEQETIISSMMDNPFFTKDLR